MPNRSEWAAWLVVERLQIDRLAAERLGSDLPDPGAPEAEALRRFRSFAAAALRRGQAATPALDGVRVDAARTGALVDAWCQAAGRAAGARRGELRALLDPLVERFRSALLVQRAARRARKTQPATRRAVVAAIDRVADAFLAVELETGRIVDANPAATVLLGLEREALLGRDAPNFLHDGTQERWRSHLEGLEESAEPRRFAAVLRDVRGGRVAVEVSATRYGRRGGPLALILARPARAGASGTP